MPKMIISLQPNEGTWQWHSRKQEEKEAGGHIDSQEEGRQQDKTGRYQEVLEEEG